MISREHRNRAITCLPVHRVARRDANLIDAAVQRRCVLEISRELNFLGKSFGIVSREATRRFGVTAQFSQMVHFTSWNIFLIFSHFSKPNLTPSSLDKLSSSNDITDFVRSSSYYLSSIWYFI